MTSVSVEKSLEVLSRYPSRYQPLRVVVLEKTGGFSGAAIVRVETESGTFCLRGWPLKSFSRNRILGLHHLLTFIFQQGVSEVSVPVVARDGSTLVVEQNRFWQLEPWMPGEADFQRHPSEARLSSAMATLARWHQAASRFSPRAEEREWFGGRVESQSPAVQERLEIVRTWTHGKCDHLMHAVQQAGADSFREMAEEIVHFFGRLAPVVNRQLETASGMRFTLQPCLRDIWHDHVLFSEEDVTGIIDASACRTENVATDLSRLLGSLLCDDHSRWEFALEKYAQYRPLSMEDQGLITVLDHSSVLLSGMTWLDRYYLKQEHFADEAAVLERMEAILRRLEFLKNHL